MTSSAFHVIDPIETFTSAVTADRKPVPDWNQGERVVTLSALRHSEDPLLAPTGPTTSALQTLSAHTSLIPPRESPSVLLDLRINSGRSLDQRTFSPSNANCRLESHKQRSREHCPTRCNWPLYQDHGGPNTATAPFDNRPMVNDRDVFCSIAQYIPIGIIKTARST